MWIALFGVLGALAGAGFSDAVEAPDAIAEVTPVFAGAGAGAGLGFLFWAAGRIFRRKAK